MDCFVVAGLGLDVAGLKVDVVGYDVGVSGFGDDVVVLEVVTEAVGWAVG